MTLDIQGLTKTFGGVTAVDGVSLTVEEGEIHALLGPNGSGKSTLIGCISGRIQPDRGTIAFAGMRTARLNPRAALAAGVAVIYQHLSLVPALSVADNVFLGEELSTAGRVQKGAQEKQATALLELLGVDMSPRARVRDLSPGQQQLVEIAKALRRNPRLLVLDEPTAALGESETLQLLRLLRRLRETQIAILYVTHLLGEVFALADRVTVLRDGRVALTSAVDAVSEDEVIQAIAPYAQQAPAASRNASGSAVGGDAPAALEVKGLRVDGCGPYTLTVDEREIVGIFGLLGSGRSELLEGVFGARRPDAGRVEVAGERVRTSSIAGPLRHGVALVPADRRRQGLFGSMTARENVMVPHLSSIRRGIRRPRRELDEFEQTAQMLRLQPAEPHLGASRFSGGNQQKLVIGRWVTALSSSRVLLLDEPTQGVDIGARQELYEFLRGYVRTGRGAVLFSSSDPEEVQALADRAYVLSRGKIVASLDGPDLTAQTLLSLAHGTASPAAAAGTHG